MKSLMRIAPPGTEPITLDEVKKNANVVATDDDSFISKLLIPAVQAKVESDLNRAIIAQRWRLTLDSFPAGNGAIELLVPPLLEVGTVSYIDEDGETQVLVDGTDYLVDAFSEPARITPAYGEDWPATRNQNNAVTVIFTAGYAISCIAVAEADTLAPADNAIYIDGDEVTVSAIGLESAVPAGLTAGKLYYVVNAGSTIQLSETLGGVAIDITDAGSGTLLIGSIPDEIRHAMILLSSHFYDHREIVVQGTIITQVPYTYKALIKNLIFDSPGEA
jgi:uncharacterized phiE125 gp8 family phage protein